MTSHAFGASAPFSVGGEEDLLLLHAEALPRAPGGEALVAGAAAFALPGLLQPELFASVVELPTVVRSTAH